MSTDFFQRQDDARRRTKWLVCYFVVSALAIAVITGAAYYGYSVIHNRILQFAFTPHRSNDIRNSLFFMGATLVVIASGSFYKMRQISEGGAVVATLLGGEPLNIQSEVPSERQLRNVVEEMAIASGVPVPVIYILPYETGINAFAAGFTTTDAVIGVTRGAMEALNRDELQAVVAHEFSHILNGDMKLNMRLMGVLNGLLWVALLGRLLMAAKPRRRTFDQSEKREQPFFLAVGIGAIIFAIGSLGLFFGKLIKSAISRQREFLADAASVQFTRNPLALAGALKKVGGAVNGSRLTIFTAEEASHLFFCNGLPRTWSTAMATHPPLRDRIRKLDPEWDGDYPFVEIKPNSPAAALEMALLSSPDISIEAIVAANKKTIKEEKRFDFSPRVQPRHVCYAAELRNAIPAVLRATAREGLGATVLVYCLLLSDDNSDQQSQLERLVTANNPALLKEIQRMFPTIAAIDRRLKLPLVNLCLPALRQLSAAQYDQFAENIRILVESDCKIYLFEYMLQKFLLRHLEPMFYDRSKPVVQYYVLRPLETDVVVLLSAIAFEAGSDPATIERAFKEGVSQLQFSSAPKLLQAEECDLPQFDTALERCAEGSATVKKLILDACSATAAADGELHAEEAEMLRAIADTFDCPLPVFIENV